MPFCLDSWELDVAACLLNALLSVSTLMVKERKRATGVQVHMDLKTKNILLSDGFDVAKIGAYMDLPMPLQPCCRGSKLIRSDFLL